MPANARRTREALGWSPSPELSITRRLPKMIANLQRDPQLWKRRNVPGYQQPVSQPSASTSAAWKDSKPSTRRLAGATR